MGFTAYPPFRGEEDLLSLKFESSPWSIERFQVIINNEVSGEVMVCILVAGEVPLRMCHGAVGSREWGRAIVCLCVQQKRSTGTFVPAFWLRRSWCSQQHVIQVTFQPGTRSTAARSFKGASLIREWSTFTVTSGDLLLQNIKGKCKKRLWGWAGAAHEYGLFSIYQENIFCFPLISSFAISSNLQPFKNVREVRIRARCKKIHELIGISQWGIWSGEMQDHQFKVL